MIDQGLDFLADHPLLVPALALGWGFLVLAAGWLWRFAFGGHR